MKFIDKLHLIVQIVASLLWIVLLIVVVINSVAFDIEPTNSEVLMLILLYLMVWIKKEG